jgi:hypothetical protein
MVVDVLHVLDVSMLFTAFLVGCLGWWEVPEHILSIPGAIFRISTFVKYIAQSLLAISGIIQFERFFEYYTIGAQEGAGISVAVCGHDSAFEA